MKPKPHIIILTSSSDSFVDDFDLAVRCGYAPTHSPTVVRFLDGASRVHGTYTICMTHTNPTHEYADLPERFRVKAPWDGKAPVGR